MTTTTTAHIHGESLREAVIDASSEIHYGNNPQGSGQFEVDWNEAADELDARLIGNDVREAVEGNTHVHPETDDAVTLWAEAAKALADTLQEKQRPRDILFVQETG